MGRACRSGKAGGGPVSGWAEASGWAGLVAAGAGQADAWDWARVYAEARGRSAAQQQWVWHALRGHPDATRDLVYRGSLMAGRPGRSRAAVERTSCSADVAIPSHGASATAPTHGRSPGRVRIA